MDPDGANELRAFGDKCLATVDGRTAQGAPAVITACDGSENQKWRAGAERHDRQSVGA